MSKQVPESAVQQLPIREQMKRLEDWIAGHRELFEKHRGGKLRELAGTFFCPDSSRTPTDDLREFDRIVGEVRILRKILAVLRRDGCSEAAEVLMETLLHKDSPEHPILLPFEKGTQGKTEPMVFLIFDPAKILRIMKWFASIGPYELDVLWDGIRNAFTPMEETIHMQELLPSLNAFWQENKGGRYVVHKEVFQAINADILAEFGGMQKWFDVRAQDGKAVAMYTGDVYGGCNSFAHNAYQAVAFGYLLRGMQQKDVLARIPRRLQSGVATWQFEVSESSWEGNHYTHHRLMLIPENEFGSWQGIYQSSLSKGVSHGYMAVYKPAKPFLSLPDGTKRSKELILYSA